MIREIMIQILEDGYCNKVVECSDCPIKRIADCHNKSWDDTTDEELLRCYVRALNLNQNDISVMYKRVPLSHLRDTTNMIDHPEHYQGAHECIDVMRAMFGDEAVKGFCRCNAYKYRFRADSKNGAEDICKAEWYEDYLIRMEKENESNLHDRTT